MTSPLQAAVVGSVLGGLLHLTTVRYTTETEDTEETLIQGLTTMLAAAILAWGVLTYLRLGSTSPPSPGTAAAIALLAAIAAVVGTNAGNYRFVNLAANTKWAWFAIGVFLLFVSPLVTGLSAAVGFLGIVLTGEPSSSTSLTCSRTGSLVGTSTGSTNPVV